MATKQNALRARVVEKREEVAEDLALLRAHLRDTLESQTDWRHVLRSHPRVSLALGAILGAVLALVLGGLGRSGDLD